MSFDPSPPPETTQIDSCLVSAVELPNGGMALMFTIPSIKRYTFILDHNGRQTVAQLCGGRGVRLFGPGDMPPQP